MMRSCLLGVEVIAALMRIVIFGVAGASGQNISPAEARAIAKEAYIYGFPMVDKYRV